ncbi:MAG TPA: hypothetical protein ACFE0H_07455 [Elainellaceae cyanobacterium]
MNSQEALTLVETILTDTRLNKLQRTVFCDAWNGKSYLEIAHSSGYELGYVKQTGSQLWQLLSGVLNERVTKHNLHGVLTRKVASIETGTPISSKMLQVRDIRPSDGLDTTHQDHVLDLQPDSPHIDWGDAVEAAAFVGRAAELDRFEQWIRQDRCRLLGLFGMGGIGKTSLSVRLTKRLIEPDERSQYAQQPQVIQPDIPSQSDFQASTFNSGFRYVIWRSLRNAPPLTALLTDLIQVLSDQRETSLPDTLDGQLRRLLHYLRQRRCLIVLDNAETIMGHGNCGSAYLPGYDGYGQLWRCLGESTHQSVAVITSREKPNEIAMMDGEALPVRSHQLQGLSAKDGQEIFHVKGTFYGSDAQWQMLVNHYAGNPLALKIVAPVIQELFDGDIAGFLDCLQEGTSVFGDIQDLLDQQVSRLSALEHDLLYWLAIARQPTSLSQLRTYLAPPESLSRLIEAMSALERRYLVEKVNLSRPGRSQPHFTLQPAVMEYATEHLIQQMVDDLHLWLASQVMPNQSHPNASFDHALTRLNTHALLQAQAKDYIRETQIRLIVKPIAQRLVNEWRMAVVEERFQTLLQIIRERSPQQGGYLAGNVINVLCQLGADLTGWNLSKLSIWNAYLRDVTLHHVNVAQSTFVHSVFKETFSQVLSVAFSPDGAYLATGDVNHEIHIWHVAEGKPLLRCRIDEGWIWSVAFSPDGKLLASSANRTVKLWDVHTGLCLHPFPGYSDRVFSVAFSPDGQYLASASEDHLVRVWVVKTGELLHTFAGHTDEVRSVAFSPDRFRGALASASYDGTVRLWNIEQGTCIRVLSGHHDWVWSVAFSPDGRTLASGSSDRTLKLWHVKTGRCLHALDHPQQIRAVAFSLDGRSVASSCDDGVIRIWDYHSGDCLRVLTGHTSWISSLAINPDSHALASGSEDQSVKLWDSQSGLCLKTLQGYSNGVWSVAFNHQGTQLASGSQDRMIRLWDCQTGELTQTLHGHSSWIWSVAFSPTDSIVASGSEDRTICLWDLSTGHIIRQLAGHRDAVLSILFSMDGKTVISSSLDGTLRLWEISTGQNYQTLTGHTGGLWCADISRNGQMVVTGSQDQTVKLWDLATGQCIDTLVDHPSWIRCVAISPDQQILVSGGADGVINVWQIQKRYCQNTIQAHSGPVLSIAFAPNGATFMSSSADGSIKCWNATTLTCCHVLNGHHRWVRSLAYSPDGMLLASSSQDETVKLWAFDHLLSASPLSIRTLRIPRPYEGMNICGTSGLTPAQISALTLLGAVDDVVDGV